MSGKAKNHYTTLNPSKQGAPLWAKYRTEMHKSFPSPFKGANDSLADGINQAIRELDHLKPEKMGGPAFLGKNSALTIDFESVKESTLSQEMSTSGNVIKQMIKLFEWFRSGKKVNGNCTPYLSFSTGFRTSEYNRNSTDQEAVIYAIKMYPMNVYITPEIMDHVLDCIIGARDEIMSTKTISQNSNGINKAQ